MSSKRDTGSLRVTAICSPSARMLAALFVGREVEVARGRRLRRRGDRADLRRGPVVGQRDRDNARGRRGDSDRGEPRAARQPGRR
jgi:hypothetical protein